MRTSPTVLRRAAGVLAAGAFGCVGAVGAASEAAAVPSAEPQFVKTIRCDSADPWPGSRLRVPVDVYTDIKFPSDGLPGPAIALKANNPRAPRLLPPLTEYSIKATVTWKNLRTGRTGAVTTHSRARSVLWEAVLHPGAGPVRFTVKQKIGAIAFVPMVNPQFSTCGATVVAR